MDSLQLKKKIRTRFAPSPTGELHVGGARTALFNYLLAKKNNGDFILRVEDTDPKRSTEQFMQEQHEDLIWLNLIPDESLFNPKEVVGPYRQSQRKEIYQKYAQKLEKEGKVYPCFCSVEELAKEKEEYLLNSGKSNYKYSRRCLALTGETINKLKKEGKPYVLRIKIPAEKNYIFDDCVREKVTFIGKDIEDFIIFRQDGSPSYNFACVIDDHLMGITHVLRGEEHLSNTGKQLVIYDYLKWETPLFGHISIILNQERKKLSKRDKISSQWQTIRQLRSKGYLATAVVNFLSLLGWHPTEENLTKEFFNLEELVKEFNLETLNSRGAVYDIQKLNWFNNHYIQELDLNEYCQQTWKFLSDAYQLKTNQKQWTDQVSLLFRQQINYFQEIIDLTRFFFFLEKVDLDLSPNIKKIFNQLIESMETVSWNETEIKSTLAATAKANKDESKKNIFLNLRKTLTGKERGPEIQKIIFLLGKEEVKQRISIQLSS